MRYTLDVWYREVGYALGVLIDPGLGVYTNSLAQSQGLGICIGSSYRARDWGYALAVLIEPGTGDIH